MIILLKHYLARLEAEESVKPPHLRRDIPSITKLAKEVGLSRQQLQSWASNQVRNINLDVTDKILKAMQRRGFPMEISDMLGYYNEEQQSWP